MTAAGPKRLYLPEEDAEAVPQQAPPLVDRRPWYHWALRDMGLPWRHVTFGLRNRIERWFRTLKERIRRFYNNFPSRKGLACVKLFLETFMYWYNHLRTRAW